MLALCEFVVFCRWTHVNCPLRDDARFGSTEYRGPPAPRTHDSAYAEGVLSEAYVGAAKQHVRLTSGINGVSPFHWLSKAKFDIIRDLNPDMMHVIVNFFLHGIPLFAGERRPGKSNNFNKPTSTATDPATIAAQQKYIDELARLTKAQTACDMFTLTPADRERVDARMSDLSRCKKYVKKSHVPFSTTEGGKKPKAADWYTRSHNVSIMLTLC